MQGFQEKMGKRVLQKFFLKVAKNHAKSFKKIDCDFQHWTIIQNIVFYVFKYVAFVAWLLLQVIINKSLVPDCRQGCYWSYSRLIFLAYKSQDVEDGTLTVMARLVILLSLPCIFYFG